VRQKHKKRPAAKHNVFGSVPSLTSYKSHDSGEITVANRIISFGKMPSYKCVSSPLVQVKSCMSVDVVRLSEPVPVIDWKDSSPK